MRVLALNSSPRDAKQSKTEMMLSPLVEGMREVGAEVEVVKLREKSIQNCLGCFSCWTQRPGRCFLDDDMSLELMDKWLASDLAVYASPLYNYGLNATMKAFIERTLPSMQPFFEMDESGRMYHPVRSKVPAAVVLSVSGMPDASHFQALSVHVNYLFSSPGRKLLAEIYRPAAEAMPQPHLRHVTREILTATQQAGRELAQNMSMEPEILESITRPLIEPRSFAVMANAFWKTCLAESVTPAEFSQKQMIPRPDSLESFMLMFAQGMNTEAAGDTTRVLQFQFSGECQDTCHFVVSKQGVEPVAGAADSPDIVVHTPFETWMDIMTGKTDGQERFLDGEYTVEGDLDMMMKLFQSE
jgi:multimeric flavodoxin WrbA/putative sterol carrier protein